MEKNKKSVVPSNNYFHAPKTTYWAFRGKKGGGGCWNILKGKNSGNKGSSPEEKKKNQIPYMKSF